MQSHELKGLPPVLALLSGSGNLRILEVVAAE